MHMVSFVLLIIGGLNWLLFGIFQSDLGDWLGGMDNIVWRIIYILVGLAAIYELFTHKSKCKDCVKSGSSSSQGMSSGM